MKNHQKGSVNVLLVIILLLVAIVAMCLYEKQDAKTVVAPVISTEQPAASAASDSLTPASGEWKTYTNSTYGFSFMYPAAWQVVESNNNKEVTVTSDSTTSPTQGGHGTMPLEVISFGVTDKSFFNPPLGTKYGEISYDSKLKTLVDSSESPARCLSASPIFSTPDAIKGITYAGSMMSDPAYNNSAILLNNGSIILADEDWDVNDNNQAENTLAKQGVAEIASTFSLLNNNAAPLAACANQN